MNYEEKYNKALEVMRQWIAPCHTKEQLDTLKKSVFPELAESEDEKALRIIRKRMCYDPVPISDEDRRIVENWLEKQKENPKSSDSIPPDCTSDVKCEDRSPKHSDSDGTDIRDTPAYWRGWDDAMKQKEWSEEDEEMINGCIHAIEYELIDNGQDEQVATDTRIAFLKSIRPQPKKEWSEDEIIYWNTIKDYFFGIPLDDKLKSALDWFKSLKPQPKQEWSDTNELVFQDICKHLKEEGCGGWVLFLKALRNGEFQPKQEWSEEDEKMRINILNALTPQLVYSVGKGTSTGTSTYKYDDEIKWLKSLKPAEQKYTLADLEAEWKHGYDFAKKETWKPREEHQSVTSTLKAEE